MINLLQNPIPEAELAAILAETAGRPALPPMEDPVWQAARGNPATACWLPGLVTQATAEALEPLPPLPDALYGDFFKTGLRLPFEKVYFERRRRLARAALALLTVESSKRDLFRESFIQKLEGILGEDSWSLPAHVWTNETGKDPLQIDLFAAETANTLAELLVVFDSVIPGALGQGIRSRLRSTIFENYTTRQPPFHWTGLPMNWNAVCHQGVLGAALAIEEDHALVARLLAMTARYLPIFLEGFGNDGSTSEGPAYWSYGFGWFIELNAQLEHRTSGRLSIIEGGEKVRCIARFAPQMTLSGGHFVNFSDGGHDGRLNASLLVYLGSRLGEPMIGALGNSVYRQLAAEGPNLAAQRCDFFHLSRYVLRVPAPEATAGAEEPDQPDAFFPDYGALVARGTDTRGHRWEFSAKGGHNEEHHNHNDCGSFLLNIDGNSALAEIGAPEYVHDFFKPVVRYTFLAARSLGHSVPFINGCEQSTGLEFAALVLASAIGQDRVEFAVDLTRCYPAEARCKKIHRTFVFEKKAGRLTVSDTYELEGPGTFESILMTRAPVSRKWGNAHLALPTAVLRVQPSPGACLTDVETCPYRGHQGTDETIQRLRFSPAVPGAAGVVSYEITLD